HVDRVFDVEGDDAERSLGHSSARGPGVLRFVDRRPGLQVVGSRPAARFADGRRQDERGHGEPEAAERHGGGPRTQRSWKATATDVKSPPKRVTTPLATDTLTPLRRFTGRESVSRRRVLRWKSAFSTPSTVVRPPV